MIQRLLDFFNQNLANDSDDDLEHKLRLASASLLIEMIRMDHKIEQAEHDAVKALIKKDFKLAETETETLFELAEEEANNAVDYFRFAQLINEHYDNDNKISIIDNLWHIAYADGHLDKYEEHYLRKVADILHIPHKAFIQSKHRVQAQRDNA